MNPEVSVDEDVETSEELGLSDTMDLRDDPSRPPPIATPIRTVRPAVTEHRASDEPASPATTVLEMDDVAVFYGTFRAVRERRPRDRAPADHGVHRPVAAAASRTILRCLNRMNDLIPGARVEGKVRYHGEDLYAPDVDPVEVRRRIGMVFQKPNPFPKSIYENVAYGPGSTGSRATWTTSSSARCAAPRSGTRSRTSSSRAAWRSPAASSSGCASPAPSRCSPT